MINRVALIFGAVLLVVGILGFVPGVSSFEVGSDHGKLFGIFAIDAVHNTVHIVSGLAAIAVGLTDGFASRIFFRVFGVIYGVVALLGLYYGSAPLLGVMANNLADVALHAVIATAALLLGFGHLLERFEHHGDIGTHHPA